MFIEIEGIDGCGKDTHGELLAKRIGARLFRFPARDTPIGRVIDGFLRGKTWIDVQEGTQLVLDNQQALTLQGLMLANRMEFAEELRQAASKGNVVCIRYWGSGYAYGRADGLDADYLKKIHEYLPQPDLRVLLNISVKESFARRVIREQYENNHKRLDQAKKFYEELWFAGRAENPHKWAIIDAEGSKDETYIQIEKAIVAFRESVKPGGLS